MSEEDTLIQQELVEEIMKASEQFPNVILYMETVMESYEELEKENQKYKEVIDKAIEYIETLNKIIPRFWFTKLLELLKEVK